MELPDGIVGELLQTLNRKGVLGEDTDLDRLIQDNNSGAYGYYIENSLPNNIPSDAKRGTILVINQSGNLMQIISCYESNKIWRRVGVNNQFKGWIEI